MQVEKEYSDRRVNERRSDTRRSDARRASVRRSNLRFNSSFKASILDNNGKTVNVSASGVYFEVITYDIEAFSPETTIPLQINAVTRTYEGRSGTVIISGRGKVIRSSVIRNQSDTYSLGVAVEFTEKLDTKVGYD
ncbi:MAG: hypothetical protein R2568_07525 [Candidatus Scalindua sp.]|jgi:hypothetical protein|nr:hypothetical protein [Candidatus Scalindua sp.]